MKPNIYSGIILILCCILSFGTAQAQYCTTNLHSNPCNTSINGDYITSFSTSGGITNISNPNTGCGGGPGNYNYYSTKTHTAFPGDVVNFQFVTTMETWSDAYKIWVDWNQNGTLDNPGELMYASSSTIPGNGTVVNGSFVVPATAPVGVTRLRIRCVFASTSFTPCSNETWGEAEDYNFEVASPVPCSGLPQPIASASTTALCAPSPVVISATNLTGGGYIYQWQSTLACFNNWNNITGATGPTYNVMSVSLPMAYRVIVTCGHSGLTDTSNVVFIYAACYCASTASSTSGADIGQVVVDTFAHPQTAPATLVNNPASNQIYSNFQGIRPIHLLPGSSYPISLTQINSAGYTPSYAKVFIDFNRNGNFLDAGELVLTQAGPAGAMLNGFNGNFTVPATATPGPTRMRVVLVQGGNSGTVNSCGSYSAGETEDYNVFIRPNWPAPTATVTNPVICEGQNINLFASSSAQCFSYSWTGPNGFTSAAANPVITNTTAAASGTYSVTVNSYGYSSAPGTVQVTVAPATVVNDTLSLCSGDTIFLGPNIITSGGSYTHTFVTPSGCDSTVNLFVTVSPIPSISSTGSLNPTTCQGSDGYITLHGLQTNTTYTVNFALNTISQPPVVLTTNAGGTLIINGLSAGTYSDITVTLNGCTSDPAGPKTLADPSPPGPPSAGNNGPLCEGATLNLTTAAVPGASYTWTGPSFFSNQQQPSIANVTTANAGVYSLTVTVSGCTSAPATTNVTVHPTPPTPVAGSNSPVCEGGTINFTSANIPGASWQWTGPVSFNSTTQNPSITNAQVNQAGTYSVVATVNGCPSAPGSTTVAVTPLSAPPAASNSGPVCPGTTLSLFASAIPGASYTWVGPNSFSATTQNPSIPMVTAAANGIYTVYATVNGCNTAVDTTHVTIYPTPAAPIVTNIDLCHNGPSAALTANGQNLLWYTTPTGGVGNTAAPIPATTTTGTTTWYVSQTINGCESPRAPLTVNVLARPAAPATTNLLYCQGTTAAPLTAVGQNLLWYTTPTGGTGTATAPVPSTATVGTTTWYVSQTPGLCESDRAPVTVTILTTPPSPVVTTPVNYCQYGSYTPLLDSTVSGVNILWYTQSAGGTGSSTAPLIDLNTPSFDTFYVAATLGSCESARLPVAVNIYPKPSAPLVYDTIYCQNSSVPPLAAAGQNLLWYTTPSGGTGSAVAPTPSTTNAGVNTWYVSQSVNGCESDRASITVTVVAQPALPVVSNPEYCQFDSAAPLTAIGQNLHWYEQASGGTPDLTPPTPSTSTPGIYTWYVTQMIGNCESYRAPVTVTVYEKPAPPMVSNPVLFCEGDSLASLQVHGSNLTWYAAATGGGGSPFTPTVAYDTVGTTYHWVTQSINGCESDRALVEVTVNPGVTAEIGISAQVFCQFDTIQLQSLTSNPPASHYNWNLGAGGQFLSGSGAGPYDARWDSAGSYTVTLTVSHLNCSATDQLEVIVKPSPEAGFAVKEHACIGEELMVQAGWNSLNASSYNWQFADATVLSGSGPGFYKLRFDQPGVKLISLQTVLNGCRSFPAFDTLIVNETPLAQIITEVQDKTCIGDTLLFQAATTLGSEKYNYVWSPEQYFNSNGLYQTEGRLLKPDWIQLKVLDPWGCEGSDSIFVSAEPCCNVLLPGAFTPNGDGRNDLFRIIGDGGQGQVTFRIVNRYGQVIFETTDPQRSWDGTFNGKPQPMGTYFYYLRYKCNGLGDLEQKGEVTLIR